MATATERTPEIANGKNLAGFRLIRQDFTSVANNDTYDFGLGRIREAAYTANSANECYLTLTTGTGGVLSGIKFNGVTGTITARVYVWVAGYSG